ncbi:MAG: polysaccharide deacetylase family protein [Clostridia bacterium]|nr:polysaccharide deacetylase family protein [Clostridia bacterium]
MKFFIKKLNKLDLKSFYICLGVIAVLVSAIGISVLFSLNKQTVRVGAVCYTQFHTDEDIANGFAIDEASVHIDEFEEFLIHLKNNNIKAITINELQQFIDGKIDLPERCMLITIDNCSRSFYKYAYPLLQEYGMPANVSIYGNAVDFASANDTWVDQYCTWTEISQMSKSGLIEFGSRTYDLHTNFDESWSAMMREDEDISKYRDILMKDMQPLNEKIEKQCGYKPQFFSYPYYAVSLPSVPILRDDLGYKFLFVGNTKSAYRYFGYSIHYTNYNPFVKGDTPENSFIKRFAPQAGDDTNELIHTIFG